MNCPFCGTTLAGEGSFCCGCGKAQPGQSANGNSLPRASGVWAKVWCVIACLVVLLAFTFAIRSTVSQNATRQQQESDAAIDAQEDAQAASRKPPEENPLEAQARAELLTPRGIRDTCGTPDSQDSDYSGVVPILTYHYKDHGSHVHFIVDEKGNAMAASISDDAGKAFGLHEPGAYRLLPCAVR